MNPKIRKTDFGVYVMKDDTHLSRWVEEERRLDHARNYIEKFRHFIPEGGTVIDAGTSIGDHTVTYASIVGPKGKVIGFEANPDVAECCQLNLKIYPWAECINKGLGESDYNAGIDVNPNVGASSVNIEGRGIHITKLDNYVDYVDRCDLMKVDIEGFEYKMLQGAEKFILKYSPVILMEINRGALESQGADQGQVFSELNLLGYKIDIADGKIGHEMFDILATKCK